MRKRPKFNKKKCMECMYHSVGLGYPVKIKDHQVTVHCNYSLTGDTCLKMTENGVVDTRGTDYDHCKLFKKGKAVEEEM